VCICAAAYNTTPNCKYDSQQPPSEPDRRCRIHNLVRRGDLMRASFFTLSHEKRSRLQRRRRKAMLLPLTWAGKENILNKSTRRRRR
jgi:hypothetical protein